jgi:hypothetical protein
MDDIENQNNIDQAKHMLFNKLCDNGKQSLTSRLATHYIPVFGFQAAQRKEIIDNFLDHIVDRIGKHSGGQLEIHTSVCDFLLLLWNNQTTLRSLKEGFEHDLNDILIPVGYDDRNKGWKITLCIENRETYGVMQLFNTGNTNSTYPTKTLQLGQYRDNTTVLVTSNPTSQVSVLAKHYMIHPCHS